MGLSRNRYLARARTLLLGGLLIIPGAALLARPSYASLTKLLPDLWNARYPLAAEKFIANPEKRGVLTALHRGRRVYYYHYNAVLPRPKRESEGKVTVTGRRTIEVWVRYRPGLREPYDFTFARRDRLPGAGRRWIR